MKIIKSYGVVADHGSRVLKLEKTKEEGLALVSYKDGMSLGFVPLSRTEANELKGLLEGELDYKTVAKEEPQGIVKSLISLPFGDCNYQTALRQATEDELKSAIEIMKADENGKHQTRIKGCENALKRGIKNETKVETKENEVETKETPKIVEFPTEDKKPKIIKLVTEGDRTYGECVVKLQKEAEQFKDSDSEYVIAGLIELCKVDPDFRNNLMREDKSYGGFMEYMFHAAQNGYCVKYGNVGWVDRDTALGLAIDYYNHDSEKEEAERKAEEEKRKAEIKAQVATKKKRGRPKKKGA